MLKIKEWWNEFKQDLIFNIVMTGLTSILILFTIWMVIIAYMEMTKIC